MTDQAERRPLSDRLVEAGKVCLALGAFGFGGVLVGVITFGAPTFMLGLLCQLVGLKDAALWLDSFARDWSLCVVWAGAIAGALFGAHVIDSDSSTRGAALGSVLLFVAVLAILNLERSYIVAEYGANDLTFVRESWWGLSRTEYELKWNRVEGNWFAWQVRHPELGWLRFYED